VAVLVHGDTSSALAAALAAFHMRMPVIHVEAGLRTGLNLSPFPEELNRRLISCIAALHLAPTATNQENLVRENIPVNQIFVTGNTGIDALHWATWLQTPFDDPALQELHNGDERIVVVTAHRRENWDGGLDGIAGGVLLLARAHPEVRFVVPLHPNPRVRQQLGERLRDHDNILLIEPLGYAQFSRLLARCHMVLTDSGGIQEEAPSLNKPVLVMRESTERTEGIKAGTLILVGTSPDRIAAEGERLLSDPDAYARMAQAPNPYGDGRAAERIVAALEHLRHGGEPPTPFGPGYDRRAVLTAAAYDLDRLEEIESRLAERQAPSDELWPT
jgi:UDP-N-acetylglucosamine 2-epimerase (non-hydrolysing)